MTKNETDKAICYCMNQSDYEYLMSGNEFLEVVSNYEMYDFPVEIRYNDIIYHGKASDITEEIAEIIVKRYNEHGKYRDYKADHGMMEFYTFATALESLRSLIGDAGYLIIIKKG